MVQAPARKADYSSSILGGASKRERRKMAKVDIVKELLEKHTDEEIIAYLDSMATGLLQNYRTATKQNQPQLLFGNLGDLVMIASVLRAMKQRNDNVEAQRQSMLK